MQVDLRFLTIFIPNIMPLKWMKQLAVDAFSTLSIYYCHIHPLQAANCCRNSRLAVDEDDLKWVNKKNVITETV